jgi:hypothetical protein
MPNGNATSRSDYRQLSKEVDEAIAALRREVRSAVEHVILGDYGARSLGRALDLERMTAWRVWTIARVADAGQAIQAMPGALGWKKLLRRLADRGVPPPALDGIRAEIDRFDRLVAGHGIDRTTLRALAAGAIDSSRESMATVAARRAAARAAASIYGVHAGTVVTGHLIAPGSRPGTVSMGAVAVFDRLGRKRPGVPWPIMRQSVGTGGDSAPVLDYKSLGDGGELPSVIGEFSTPGIVGAEIRSGRHERGVETIDLCDVPAERNRRLRVTIAEFIDGIEVPDKVFGVNMSTPVHLPIDTLVLDLVSHRSLVRHTEPVAALLGTPIVPEHVAGWKSGARLPLEVTAQQVKLPKLPARFSTLDGSYLEALRRVAAAQGGKLADYEIFRLVLPYPPMFGVAMFTFEALPVGAGSASV